MVQLLNRKWVVNTLGVAGVGLGLLASAVGTPSAMALENQSPGIDHQFFQYEYEEGAIGLNDEELEQLLILLRPFLQEVTEGAFVVQDDEDARDIVNARPQGGERGGNEALRVEAYHEFTQALADELEIDDPDEVDAAIRGAMMSVVDSNAGLTKSGAERQKALIAAADAPIGPAYRGHGG